MVDANSLSTAISPDKLASTGTAAINNSWLYIQIFFVIILIIGIFLIIRFMLSFNILVVIQENTKGNERVYTRKAKVFYNKKTDGANLIQRIKIFGVKKPVMLPSSVKNSNGEVQDVRDCFGVGLKGKLALRMLKEGDEYTVITWRDTALQDYLRITKPHREQWANNLFREGMELFAPKKGFWDSYGGAVMMAGSFIIIAVIFIFLFNKLDNLQAYSAALNNYASAITELAKAVRETGVQRLA